MREFKVVDLSTSAAAASTVKAANPEKAAELALGLQLVRSGAPRDLWARVYFQNEGQPMSIVRLYCKVAQR